MSGEYFWRSSREMCFSIDIPLYRTSGRSPDSRFNELAAFPTRRSVASWPALRDHSGGAVPDFHRLPY